MARGHELLRQGQLDEAQQILQAALTADPTNSRVMALLGLAHFRAGTFEPARALYEQLTVQFPAEASHHLNLGLAHLKLGNAAHAVDALEKSRAIDPSQGRTVAYLGLAYARAGRYPQAYRAFLLAGQPELANEVAPNIGAAVRGSIHAELQQSGIPSLGENSASSDSFSTARSNGGGKPSGERSAPAHRDSTPLYRSIPNSARSRISAALAVATPTSASASSSPREPSDAKQPVPLSQFATVALVRPDDSGERFEIGQGGVLVMRVADRLYTRLDGVVATSGSLTFDPAMRRRHGRQTADRFDCGGSQLHAVAGQGYLLAVPRQRTFSAMALDDDVLYIREDLVFAFDASVRWENGYVPGLRTSSPFVQFRGDGAVVLACERPLVRVKLPAQTEVAVDSANLAGWVGRVIPRASTAAHRPGATAIVECSGEGIILVDPTETASVPSGD